MLLNGSLWLVSMSVLETKSLSLSPGQHTLSICFGFVILSGHPIQGYYLGLFQL